MTRKFMMFLKLSLIVGSGALAWWAFSLPEREANRLEQEGTGGVLGRIVPKPVELPAFGNPPERDDVREIDDIPPNRVELVQNPDGWHLPKVLAAVDHRDQEKMRKAAEYRNLGNAISVWWWFVPVAVALLLFVKLPKRRLIVESAATERPEMELIAQLIELERLRQAKPEAGKEGSQ